jgi:hypothetical protein
VDIVPRDEKPEGEGSGAGAQQPGMQQTMQGKPQPTHYVSCYLSVTPTRQDRELLTQSIMHFLASCARDAVLPPSWPARHDATEFRDRS